jgi:glutathione peroxidase-family protein
MSQPQVDSSSIFDTNAMDLDGNVVEIDSFNGKCLLIVNIALNCKMMKSNIEGLRRLKQTFENGKNLV